MKVMKLSSLENQIQKKFSYPSSKFNNANVTGMNKSRKQVRNIHPEIDDVLANFS